MRRGVLYLFSLFLLTIFFTQLFSVNSFYYRGQSRLSVDKVQEALDRCNQKRGVSPEMRRNIREENIKNISFKEACSEEGAVLVQENGRIMIRTIRQSPEDIVKNFCAHKKTKKWINFDIDWSSPESSLRTLNELERKIRGCHSFRKACIKKGTDKGKKRGWFDEKINEFRIKLNKECEVRKKLVEYKEKLFSKADIGDVDRNRLNAVTKTLQNRGAVFEKKYSVGDIVELSGKEYEVSADELESFVGNDLQHCFHKQILDCFDKSLRGPPSELTTFAIGSLKCAYGSNKRCDYNLTSVFTDLADSVVYCLKRVGNGLAKGGIDIQRGLNYLLRGGELSKNTNSISSLFEKIKNQSIKETVGDAFEFMTRGVVCASAIIVAGLTVATIAEAGVAVASGISGVIAAQKFLEPFSLSVSPDGLAVLDGVALSGVSAVESTAISVAQAAMQIQGLTDVVNGLYFSASGPSNSTGGAVMNNRDNWHKGTFDCVEGSREYHLRKHGKGRTIEQYTKDAMDFYNKNKKMGKIVQLKDGTTGIKIQTKHVLNGKTVRIGGYWTFEGKIVTFWD